MSRSGYSDDYDNMNLYRGTVTRSLKGKRGQKFLVALAKAMDDMPEKKLIKDELINKEGQCCTVGVICKAREIDMSKLDYDPDAIADVMDISGPMAREIFYLNDEHMYDSETPEKRWVRMRDWVSENINLE